MINFFTYIFVFLFTFFPFGFDVDLTKPNELMNVIYHETTNFEDHKRKEQNAINRGETGAGIFSLKNFGNENTNGMSNTEWMKENNLSIGNIGLLNDITNVANGSGEGETQVVSTAIGTVVVASGIALATAKFIKDVKDLLLDTLFDSDNSSGQEPENMNNNDNNGGDKEPNSWCAKHPKLCLDFNRSTSVNQMQKQVQKGKAPKEVKRVDKGKIFGEQDHVHLDDGRAINKDGTFKHNPSGNNNISNAVKEWLKKNGWK